MKSKSKQQSTTTYNYMTPPTTPQQQEFDTWAHEAFNTPDPNIPYTFANMREGVNNRLDNPFGADYSPEVRDAIRYNENNKIDQAQGQALREDTFNRQAGKGAALATSAAGHAPNLVATGSQGTSTTTQPILPPLIGAGASLGSAALM